MIACLQLSTARCNAVSSKQPGDTLPAEAVKRSMPDCMLTTHNRSAARENLLQAAEATADDAERLLEAAEAERRRLADDLADAQVAQERTAAELCAAQDARQQVCAVEK